MGSCIYFKSQGAIHSYYRIQGCHLSCGETWSLCFIWDWGREHSWTCVSGNSWSCPLSVLLGSTDLARPCSPCGNSRMGNHASSWPLECQRSHMPVAHLALCLFSPQVKSHSLRWTFKGPAVGVSNAAWAPEARLGRRVTPARPYESHHAGQLSGVEPSSPARCSLAQGTCSPPPSWTPADTSVCLQPCRSCHPRAVTSGTPCSPGPASGHAPALPAPSSGGRTHPFLRLVCGKAPLPLPSQERK